MFLEKTIEKNNKLIEAGTDLYKKNLLLPDTYLVDVDNFLNNAKLILEKANEDNIKLYFMLKQLGRNPYLAKKLVEIGYKGAVVVDFKEAQIMMDNNIPLGNVGHLVQTPKHLIKKIMKYGTEVFTVYSFEKLKEINESAIELNMVQDVIIKVSGKDDIFYSGQLSGIELDDLKDFISKSSELSNINIIGVTAFPCYKYSEETNKIEKTNNYYTVEKACVIMKQQGIKVTHINTPSTTSILTLEQMKNDIGNVGEPGHGFTGSTPAHANNDLVEIPSVIYITEISHNFRGKSYCYGGGHYRRSHVKNCLVVDDNPHISNINKIEDDSIDYYFELDGEEKISSPAIMAFRFQIFVTRSNVVLIEGVNTGNIKIVGRYNTLGGVTNE